MPAVRKGRRSVEELIRTELQQIRANVVGVRGSLVATSDGLVVTHDIPDVEPTQIAALAAATLAVARRAILATECGAFREALARGSDGYLAVYAAGDSAIVAVAGTSSLNVGMLQYRAREIIERIAAQSSQIGAMAAPARAAAAPARAAAAPARAAAAPARNTRSLPRRRPAASS